MKNIFSSIPTAIKELQKGKMLIVVDDPNRENQGDIIFPAETITTEKANFLMKEGRGMFCVPMTRKRAAEFDIPLMVPKDRNTEMLHCNFSVTVDAHNVRSHGISAADRALTIQTLIDPNAKPTDLLRPGHVSPIVAVDGGVLERNGHTEASIDLARLAGFSPMAVLTEIIRDDGATAVLPDLVSFGKKHSLKIITIRDLALYLKKHPLPALPKQSFVVKLSEATLPTIYGTFLIRIYKSLNDNKEHAVLSKGNFQEAPSLVRIHSKCFTGDTLSSLRCDCQEQLHASMKAISNKGSGAVVYLNQEGRDIGLSDKIKAYALQDQGLDTVEANEALELPIDARDYKTAAEILKDLGIAKIQLLTNNPDKIEQLEINGIKIVKRIPLETIPNKFNKHYLQTKKLKFHHQLIEV